MKLYCVYELTPAPWGDSYRYIKGFDIKSDAQFLLKSLEKLNFDFSVYKIVDYQYKENK